MTFQVDPSALYGYSSDLRSSYSDLEDAKTYVHVHGDFSFHETGLIGVLSGQHGEWMSALDEMLGHLLVLTFRSAEALVAAGETYDSTDATSAAKIDAALPPTPRPSPTRE
jgi:hypothetical protein